MAYVRVLWVIIAALVIETTPLTEPALELLRVGAFNVQILGKTKMQKKDVRDILAKVINRYDIFLIQEIRDKSGDALGDLLSEVNKLAPSNNQYDTVVSAPLGRTSTKEQYAFMYRTKLVSVVAEYTYEDRNDVFEREPYAVLFSAPMSAVQDMVFVAIHTKPGDAVTEIDHLVDVHDDVVRRWKIANVVIMGDLNAACNYVKNKDWKNIRLATDKRFWWLIDDCQDTSVQGLRCAYDRFIATGTELLSNIVAKSARMFNFMTVYNLNEQQTKEVSDHFPIEFHIEGREWKQVEKNMDYILTSSLPAATKTDVYKLRQKPPRGYTEHSQYKGSGGTSSITLTKTATDITSATSSIRELRTSFPSLVTESQAQLAEYHLSRFHMTTDTFPYQVLTEYTSMFMVNGIKIKIQLSCDVEVQPISCRVVIGKTI